MLQASDPMVYVGRIWSAEINHIIYYTADKLNSYTCELYLFIPIRMLLLIGRKYHGWH